MKKKQFSEQITSGKVTIVSNKRKSQKNHKNYTRLEMSDKNFFWHGILSLNELGAHAFFDVKIKKNVPDAPNMVGIFTSDIPPLPLTQSDTLHVTFLLENNVGLNTVRYRVAESQFTGAELMKAVEETTGPQSTITATVESGEWQFSLQQQTWILRSILLYVPMAQLRKFIKDP